eukprot:1078490-Pelagomonas_calceolata.AAC.1
MGQPGPGQPAKQWASRAQASKQSNGPAGPRPASKAMDQPGPGQQAKQWTSQAQAPAKSSILSTPAHIHIQESRGAGLERATFNLCEMYETDNKIRRIAKR